KGGNTAARAAGFKKGDAFHICLLFPDHDVYERTLAGRKRADFETSEFTPWALPDEKDDEPNSHEDLVALRDQTIQSINSELIHLKSRLTEKEEENLNLSISGESREEKIQSLIGELKTEKASLGKRETQLEAVRKEIAS